ncbi:MAG: DUF58 domain-containing protein [Treponema sp.]|jgi:uncharacterized protein (DUF58 family)|nr:DUF58 domain-containing protein [Treponema sp.]
MAMMDRWELLRRATAFPLSAGGLSEELLAGSFRSVFKGQGIEFDEARHYETGDDARFIDWNVSARLGEPYVKLYREERELSVFIILDSSPSMFTSLWPAGAEETSAYDQAVFAAALIAFSAEKAGQRVGALFFNRDIVQVFPPRKGRRHIMGILGAAVERGQGKGPGKGQGGPGEGLGPQALDSNVGAALRGVGRFLKRRSLVVLVSDFFASAWEQEFEDLAIRHDLIALGIGNPLDREFPDLGLVPLEDPETGLRFYGASSAPAFRKDWSRWHRERRDFVESLCRRAGAACLFLAAGEDSAAALSRFFSGRRPVHRVRRRPSPRGFL